MEMEFFVEPGTDEEWHEYWINERMAGGSLWPSYLIHAVAHVFGAGLVLAGIV